jgi:hypothetical protein
MLADAASNVFVRLVTTYEVDDAADAADAGPPSVSNILTQEK